MRTLICLIEPWDLVGAARTNLYVGDAPTPAGLGLGGFEWEAAFTTRPTLTVELMNPDMSGKVLAAKASFTIQLANIDNVAGLTNPTQKAFAGAPVMIWSVPDLAYANRALEFTGFVTTATFDPDTLTLALDCNTSTRMLQVPLLWDEFVGAFPNEDVSLRGQPKPAGFGVVPGVEPIWFDTINNIGMVEGYGNLVSIQRLLEGASQRDPAVADYADYAHLQAAIAAGAIGPGQWGTSIAAGLVGLGAPPQGIIMCDCTFGNGTPATLTHRVLNVHAAVPDAQIDLVSLNAIDAAMQAMFGHAPALHFWTKAARQVDDLLGAVAGSCNANLLVSPQGLITMTRGVSSAPVATLNRNGQIDPRVLGWKSAGSISPFYLLRAQAARPATVLTLDQINFYDTFTPEGNYDPAVVYRPGNLVFMPDGSQWLYRDTAAAGKGVSPPTDGSSSNATWERVMDPLSYSDGTPLDALKPTEISANKTEIHTAAAIAGQGSGATANSLSQLNSTDGTKLAGVETGATAGSNLLANAATLSGWTVGGTLTAGAAGDPAANYMRANGAVKSLTSPIVPLPANASKVWVSSKARADVAGPTSGFVNGTLSFFGPTGALVSTLTTATFFQTAAWGDYAPAGLAVPLGSSQVRFTLNAQASAGHMIDVALPSIMVVQPAATVGGTLSVNIIRFDGVTVVTDAAAITSLGTASAIAGQGALATANSVDLSTTQVTNKSLANVDFTASLKLNTIDTGATLGDNFVPNASSLGGFAFVNLTPTAGGAADPVPNLGLQAAVGTLASLTSLTFTMPPSGSSLYAGGWAKPGVSGQHFQILIDWFAGGGAFLSSVTLDFFPTGTAWTWLEATVARPNNAVAAAVQMTIAVSTAAGRIGGPRLSGAQIGATVGSQLGTNTVRQDGTTAVTDATAITSLGTASAIAGQGALATANAVDLAGSTVLNKTAGNIAYTGGATVDSLKPAQVGADATASHTAAAIAGQGALATMGAVDLSTAQVLNKTAVNIVYTGGSTVDSLKPAQAGADVTSSSTASAIAGQGALATLSSVDLSTGQVINKSLANLDATANTKLSGIQALADVTSAHTAAAITGQGSFATLSQTYFGDGLLKESNAGATATLTNFKTSLGTASAIAAQGALATLSVADFATQVGGTAKPDNNATAGDNWVKNSSLAVDASYWTLAGTIRTVGAAGDPAPAYFNNTSGANSTARITTLAPIPGSGTSAFFEAWFNSPVINRQSTIDVYFYDATATFISAAHLNIFAATTAWEKHASPFAIPAGAVQWYMILTLGIGVFAAAPKVSWAQTGATLGADINGINLVDGGSGSPTTPLTRAVVLTSLGTASAIAGQGSFATLSQTFFGDGLLKETSAGATATLGNFKTSLGTSASLASQGALATLNAVDLAGSTVLNKTAGNITYGSGATVESLKPAAAGADVTSANTAAGIVSQGALATRAFVYFGSSTVTEDSGGTTQASLANFKTVLGTASAIASQGSLATASKVNLGASGNVYRDDNATHLTDSLAVTSLGTAASIASQGALATLNAVDLAGSTVLNKLAANISWAAGGTVESLKPAEAASDKTANQQILVNAPPTATIALDSTGAIKAGQLPYVFPLPNITKGNSGNIAGTDNNLTYAISNVAAALGTVTINNTGGSSTKGQITLANTPTAFTGAGSLTLTVSYNGAVVWIGNISVLTKQDAPSSGGGGGALSGNTGNISDTVSSTSYVQVGAAVTVTVASGKSIHGTFSETYVCGGVSKNATAGMKWQYQVSGGGWTSPTDFGSQVTGTQASTDASFDQTPGSIACNQNVTPAANTYDVRLVCVKTGTAAGITLDGSAPGYVTVS